MIQNEKDFIDWLDQQLNDEIPNNVIAFNINVYESPFNIEIIGSSKFDPDDEDWVTNHPRIMKSYAREMCQRKWCKITRLTKCVNVRLSESAAILLNVSFGRVAGIESESFYVRSHLGRSGYCQVTSKLNYQSVNSTSKFYRLRIVFTIHVDPIK